MNLQPITAGPTLKDHIYEVMRAALIDMDVYGDDTPLKLDERTVAEQLGISRTPLREALARLEQEGFLTIVPRRGVFVVRKSREEILEMILAWAALEAMAARLAATEASDAQIAALRAHAESNSASAERADLAEYSEANMIFHQMVLGMSGVRLLARMAEALFVHMHAVRRRAMAEGDRAQRSVADHMAIIEALEARDPDAADSASRDHTMRLYAHIAAHWTWLEPEQRDDAAEPAANDDHEATRAAG
jgi:DNA-binding GntR family transcriptional regulator